MHGRKRLPSGQNDHAKQEATLKKVHKYNALQAQALEKRINAVYDETALTLTAGVLQACADFYTLWNHRRDIFNTFLAEKSEDEIRLAMEAELKMLEGAIMESPKSYSLWHHRMWAVQKGGCSLQHELDLCAKFLNADERNFHCWNYRRKVAELAGETPQQTTTFTTEKINQNFSNYSAWHQRSKTLPLVLKDADKELRESTIAKELEYVEQAFYTEPDDQSAWLYHRWLLAYSRGDEALRLVGSFPEHRAIVSSVPAAILLLFSEPVAAPDVHVSCPQPLALAWSPVRPGQDGTSALWAVTDLQPLKSVLELLESPGGQLQIVVSCPITTRSVGGVLPSHPMELHFSISTADSQTALEASSATSESMEGPSEHSLILTKEIDRIQQLLSIEPSCKYALLNLTLLERSLALESGKDALARRRATLLDQLDALIKVDPFRIEFYRDLKSDFIVQSSEPEAQTRSLSLPKASLTRFTPSPSFLSLQTLDISGNCLRSLDGLEHLYLLEKLIADDNKITDVTALQHTKPFLRVMSLKNNALSSVSGFQDLPGLQELSLQGNPLPDDALLMLLPLLPALKHLSGLTVI